MFKSICVIGRVVFRPDEKMILSEPIFVHVVIWISFVVSVVLAQENPSVRGTSSSAKKRSQVCEKWLAARPSGNEQGLWTTDDRSSPEPSARGRITANRQASTDSLSKLLEVIVIYRYRLLTEMFAATSCTLSAWWQRPRTTVNWTQLVPRLPPIATCVR